MDSLPHQWKETKISQVKFIFIFEDSLSKLLLKSSHMSADKPLWCCDLWEDLFAAALWDYRELLNCSISVFFWVSNLAKGAILPLGMTFTHHKKRRKL